MAFRISPRVFEWVLVSTFIINGDRSIIIKLIEQLFFA